MSKDELTFGAGRRPGTPLTMSSLEIADLTEKRHDNVVRDIKRMLLELYGEPGDTFEALENDPSKLRDQVKSVTWRKDARGYVASFHLDKSHAVTLVAGYDARMRKRIIDRWQQLEAEVAAGRPALPDFTDPVMAARAWADEVEAKTIARQRAAALEAKVKEQSVKVAALDRIATANGSTCISTSAKTLQMKPSELFTYMRNHGWIFRRGGNGRYVAHQPRINAGYLEHKVEVIPGKDGDEHTFEQVRVTPRGLTVLARLLGKPTQGRLL
ncbi:phage regulatory protein/antirepressor Ant [Xanthobacter autotrophicus]|uniref:phage regulatory protein/antirepressor Ant n=1 Tax=Xanthobacter TaxID=279 RepID=UPI0024ABCF90|nr:phage regulatory protein/antirepressor Ant [Xanthobacter autotrophicus]MDI4666586.1 phage regulatory protein/antirepressor Ant [Xanthobacter autotrophicus]